MSYKILTKNGIDNTNIDGARSEHFNAGMRDGIVKGALNEGTFGTNANNSIFLDSCELRISGHRIVINEPVYKTFTNAPSSNVRYSYVAQIIVDDNSNVEFSLLVQSANIELIQDNLFKTTNGKGTYQVEIGRFTLQTDGTITDIVRTIDVITGGISGEEFAIDIGNVTTEKININLDAEVDIDKRYDADKNKEYLDFKFNLPVDVAGAIPTTLPNPKALTIKQNGETKGTYDGSSTVDIDLESGGGSTTEEWTVIYDKDSTDTAINIGYPGGLTGSLGKIDAFLDLTPYNTMRVKFYALNSEQYHYFDISKPATGGCRILTNNLTTSKIIGVNIIVSFADDKQYITIGNFTSLSFAANKYTTITNLKDDKTFYISKIEVKKSFM